MRYFRSRLGRNGRMIAAAFVIGVCAMTLLYMEFMMPHSWEIKGKSMEPVLFEGDVISCRRVTGREALERYDIVLVDGIADHLSVKCILGLPGDVVRFSKHGVYVNETSIAYPNTEEFEFECKLEDDEYFVVGTNAEDSIDSRYVGALKRNQIQGVYVGTNGGEYIEVATIMGW